MAYQKNFVKKMTPEQCNATISKLRQFLNLYGIPVAVYDDEKQCEAYVYSTPKSNPERQVTFAKYFRPLYILNMVYVLPMEEGQIIVFSTEAEQDVPTISPTHLRLPKLSHLITLVPEDFFAIFEILSNATVLPQNTLMRLNLEQSGIYVIPPVIEPFFQQVRVNYRMNKEYADRKWTSWEVVRQIAGLDHNLENQFWVMQYLTALQNADLMYFPADTSVNLELDWEQVTTAYVAPQYDKTFTY